MNDRPTTETSAVGSGDPEQHSRDRGALWHFREASKYASRASYLTADPAAQPLELIRLPNPEVQRHYREMAMIHATLFAGLAQALVDGSHGAARSSMLNIASLPDEDH